MDTKKGVAGKGWVREAGRGKTAHGWKGVRPRVRLKSRTVRVGEERKNTSVSLHSVINNGLIPGGQNSSKRQTVFFLPIDPRDKGHKDPDVIDLRVPRHAQYLHNAWKKHQDTVYWVDINLAIRKDEHSTTLDRMLSSFKKHFHLIVFQKLLD